MCRSAAPRAPPPPPPPPPKRQPAQPHNAAGQQGSAAGGTLFKPIPIPIGREGTSEAAPEAVRQAVGGGCQSGWGLGYCRLQILLRLAPGVRETVAEHRLGALEGGGGGVPSLFQCFPARLPPEATRCALVFVVTPVEGGAL